MSLPGFGEIKSRVFVGVVGKHMGVRPPGWEKERAQRPSIADVAYWEDVAELRAAKREMKKAARARAKRKPNEAPPRKISIIPRI